MVSARDIPGSRRLLRGHQGLEAQWRPVGEQRDRLGVRNVGHFGKPATQPTAGWRL